MPTRSIDLTDHLDQFVAEQVRAGRYQDSSDVMRASLRLHEQQAREEQEKLVLLRSLATEAFNQLDQGQGIEFSEPWQLASFIGQIGQRAAKVSVGHSSGT
jgi:antitoxin ParD1/3/4